MIYYVTNNSQLFNSSLYQLISVNESLILLDSLQIVSVDTETQGLDPYSNKLLLLQLGNKDIQVVIDCITVNVLLYKNYLESDRLFIFCNAKFDLKFLLHHKIIFKNIYDTYLAETLLYLGYPKGQHKRSLKSMAYEYYGVSLDKSIRDTISYSDINDSIILYAAKDVEYLELIMNKQIDLLKEKDLITALKYENKFCIVLAYIEYCGVKLDINKWKLKIQEDLKIFNEVKIQLDNWVSDNLPNSKYCTINKQGSLFEGFNVNPICNINWNSSKQIIPLFNDLGFKLDIIDKETKELKKSIDAKIIKAQQNISTISPIYLKYTAYQKTISTYGENILKQVNPISGRLHTNFNQLGADTGRLSSGGTDKNTDTKYINFQNFPAQSNVRECFVAEEGNNWISCDYSGQESRILADITLDKAMLELFNNGSGDVHSLVAKMAYNNIIGDTKIEDIKHKFPNLRQEAKGIEFSVNYGGDFNTIALNKNISKDEAKIIYYNYMKGFEGITKYQLYQRNFVKTHNYILLNAISRHKSYIYNYDRFKEIKAKFNEDYWAKYNILKETDPTNSIVEEVKYYFRTKSSIEKHSINYPCQGTGAIMFKLACILFYKYLIENNLLFIVKICVPVHDEINIECPINITEKMTIVLQECMSKAGSYFCKNLEIPANAEVDNHWVH